MEEDRKSVTVEFKFSKNYNSVGGAVSYSSSKRPDETTNDLFNRIYSEADSDIDALLVSAKKLLGM